VKTPKNPPQVLIFFIIIGQSWAIMLDVLLALLRSVLSGFRSHSWLVLEKLVLRHQLAVLKRQTRKPKLRPADPLLWVGLLRFWPRWQHALSNEHKESRRHLGMSIGTRIPNTQCVAQSGWLNYPSIPYIHTRSSAHCGPDGG
jgi:hypothetical protein